MAYDWKTIEVEYVCGFVDASGKRIMPTLQELCDKYDCSLSTIMKKSSWGKWKEKRHNQSKYISKELMNKTSGSVIKAFSNEYESLVNIVKDGLDKHTSRDKTKPTLNYTEWVLRIHEQNNFQCERCGSGNDLEAHHIYNYASIHDLRLDPDNGTSFCRECHILFHQTHGKYNNNLNQVRMFISDVQEIQSKLECEEYGK
jgi:hypothetical protein